MKLVIIKFDESVNTSILTLGAEVVVTCGEADPLAGTVMATPFRMEDPPTLEGDFHIAPVE